MLAWNFNLEPWVAVHPPIIWAFTCAGFNVDSIPFWLSATFVVCGAFVVDSLPSSLLHWRAFGGNGAPHIYL